MGPNPSNASQGVTIPTTRNISRIDFHRAEWVLVIEKDASSYEIPGQEGMLTIVGHLPYSGRCTILGHVICRARYSNYGMFALIRGIRCHSNIIIRERAFLIYKRSNSFTYFTRPSQKSPSTALLTLIRMASISCAVTAMDPEAMLMKSESLFQACSGLESRAMIFLVVGICRSTTILPFPGNRYLKAASRQPMHSEKETERLRKPCWETFPTTWTTTILSAEGSCRSCYF